MTGIYADVVYHITALTHTHKSTHTSASLSLWGLCNGFYTIHTVHALPLRDPSHKTHTQLYEYTQTAN